MKATSASLDSCLFIKIWHVWVQNTDIKIWFERKKRAKIKKKKAANKFWPFIKGVEQFSFFFDWQSKDLSCKSLRARPMAQMYCIYLYLQFKFVQWLLMWVGDVKKVIIQWHFVSTHLWARHSRHLQTISDKSLWKGSFGKEGRGGKSSKK